MISLIIPTKNEERDIGRCLESLKSQDYSQIEIIVVDNYSADRTCKIAKKYTTKVFTKGPERSYQRNFGARKATGEILFFLDADMEIERCLLEEVEYLLGKDPKIKGLVVPEKTVGRHLLARIRALERSCYLSEPSIEAARIFPRKFFLKIGGFDENMIAAEDWDLTQRVYQVGKIGRTKSKIIHHEESLSLLSHLRKKYYYAKDIQEYARKHPSNFESQSGVTRLELFAKNWRKMVADPVLGLGVLILKSLEYSVFLLAKLKTGYET